MGIGDAVALVLLGVVVGSVAERLRFTAVIKSDDDDHGDDD